LPTNREPSPMTKATVAGDVFEPRNALGHLPPQLPLHDVVLVEERGQAGQFVFVEFTGRAQRIDSSLMAQFASDPRANAIEILQGVDRLFLRGNVDAEKPGHGVGSRR
jgi:hypothetical protein